MQTPTRHGREGGFTLVEMAVTILVLGMLFAIAVPTLQSVSTSHNLQSNAQGIAAQLRIAREKAIATGMDQPMHFTANFMDSDYHIHYVSGFIPAKWKLSPHITYYWGAGTSSAYTMTRDGRCSNSGMVILEDMRGFRDTVSVLTSGLVLTK